MSTGYEITTKNNNVMKLLMITILILGLSINHLRAQESSDSLQVAKFLKIFEKEGIDKAISFIYTTNKLDSISCPPDSSIIQLKTTIPQLGSYFGYEFIKKKRITNSLAVYSYLIKYDKFPIRFTFILYKAQSWRIQLFNFDTNIFDELNNSRNITWD